MKIKRALISVSDKTGLVILGKSLAEHNIEILSTGGTAEQLAKNNVKVSDVSEYTGFPEIMSGRVKTLHPLIHGGLLGIRNNKQHHLYKEEQGIQWIDLLIVNLYPFEETVASRGNFEECLEKIDIGGPAMIRSAAKNYNDVTVIVDPNDYEDLLFEIKRYNGETSTGFRKKLAYKAFSRTAAYDSAISQWLANNQKNKFPEYFSLVAEREKILRYGENPHQQAAVYKINTPEGLGTINDSQLQGKSLSFNNINDASAAHELVADLAQFGKPTIAIIKHANPCGVAIGNSLIDAYRKAVRCDPTSAFGGIVSSSHAIDKKVASAICEIFTEVVIAPNFDDEAKEVFSKLKNIRVLKTAKLGNPLDDGFVFKSITGGYLVQTRDIGKIRKNDLQIVTKRKPRDQEIDDMIFAFFVAKHTKSNAIVYAKNGATVGIGSGQTSRLDAALIATQKSQSAAKKIGSEFPLTRNSVAASDAFFPFPDGLLATIEAGASAVIQPGGSVRDAEVISAADDAGIAMVMTGIRHFRH